jgi:hypothetical protein
MIQCHHQLHYNSSWAILGLIACVHAFLRLHQQLMQLAPGRCWRLQEAAASGAFAGQGVCIQLAMLHTMR